MVNNGITMAIFMVVNGSNYGISTFISWDIILQLYRGSSSQVRSQGRSKTAVINVKTTGTRLLDSNPQKIEKEHTFYQHSDFYCLFLSVGCTET